MHASLLLPALLLVPVLGAVAAMANRAKDGAAYAIAVTTASIELVLSFVTAGFYKNTTTGFDFSSSHVLSSFLGLRYSVALDGISLLMVILSSITVLFALLGARDRRREAAYVSWQLLLLAVTVGCFVAHDLLEFFVFFELILIPCYFMMTQWGGANAKAAAMKFFLYTFTGSAGMLIGSIYLAVQHQHEFGGAITFDYTALQQVSTSATVGVWLFVAFAIAFGVKSPIWPLHTWSPSTYAAAPTAAGIELSALLSKLGAYGLLRFGVALLPTIQHDVRPVMLTLAVISILYGSFVACTAKDLRRFIAYSSLAQMGFVTLGIMSGSTIGTEGAVLLMFNHGVITLGVFTVVGYLERRRQNVALGDLRGLQGPMPVLAGLFMVFMLATMGLPGLNGFISEYLILIGAFTTHTWFALAGTVGVVGSAVYWLWAYQRAFHGPVASADAGLSDVSQRERLVLWPIVAIVVALGVFPSPVLNRIAPSVQHITASETPGVTK